MDFVTDMVAIGDAYDFSYADGLNSQGIGAILSLAKINFPTVAMPHVFVEVSDKQPLSGEAINAAVQFVRDHVDMGLRVLVHCRSGISRSPALVACYLHEHEGFSIDEALARVKAARPQAEPHKALVQSIRAYYDPDGTPAPIDLSANENPWGPSPAVVGEIINMVETVNRYPDGSGGALKKALARALGVEPKTIVLGNGSSEILEMTARAVLDPEDEAIIGWPSFPAYRQAVGKAGGKTVLAPLVDYAYDLDAMAERISARTRVIILGNPNNPTGKAIGREALGRFLERLPSDVTVLLDEAYCDYADRSNFPNSVDYLARGYPMVVARTFSKAYGLAGLRIGYALASEPLAQRIDAQRQRFNTNSLAQTAAIAALGDRDHLARTIVLNAEGRTWLLSRLAEFGLFCVHSETNFLMVEVGDGADVVEKLEKAGVRVKGLHALGLPNFIRVSIGYPTENARFVNALGGVLSLSGSSA